MIHLILAGDGGVVLAQQPLPWLVNLWIAFLAIVFIGLFIVVVIAIIKGLRWFERSTANSQARFFQDVTAFVNPPPGLEVPPELVVVRFHTYSGILIYVLQYEHLFWVTPTDARKVLSRMHWHNLTIGFFAYGILIVPLLSLANYWVQLRSISRQEAGISTPT
ncbi:hypothetical protein Spb1_09450 [Planctopirus ephydatiae]|uniref:Uncharacterized protein n=1 Tax=Planctopirus ephydatiae TaxID=2528019 RepID=A0A518GKI4_9PLAN|nr:hypothetical protein [Planctopirus ephydatiae]QDV29077.1 hypothetical protein Spb1_09450 [Planctopirus ephydatiae]